MKEVYEVTEKDGTWRALFVTEKDGTWGALFVTEKDGTWGALFVTEKDGTWGALFVIWGVLKEDQASDETASVKFLDLSSTS